MCNEIAIEFVSTIAWGRMYDPVMSSFLSPDNYVQSPDYSQSFNRYSYCWNNPLKYTDPSGELIGIDDIIIGAAIGIMFNTTMQFVRGNVNSAADMHTAMFVGALSGAAGAWAGGEAAEVFGTFGAADGGLTGASGGAAGGFVGSACDAWCHGATFGQGFTAGLIGAGIGIGIGGTIGALSGGISAKRCGGDFWTGKGARFNHIATTAEVSNVTVGEGMEYSNRYASKFSEENFDFAKGVDNLYADGSIPDGYSKTGDIVFDEKNRPVLGTTEYNGIGKGSDVYLYKSAFVSKEQLYLTMGHEYIHCAQNFNGRCTEKYQENAAYSWEKTQAQLWGVTNVVQKCDKMLLIYSDAASVYNASNFGFYPLNVKPFAL